MMKKEYVIEFVFNNKGLNILGRNMLSNPFLHNVGLYIATQHFIE